MPHFVRRATGLVAVAAALAGPAVHAQGTARSQDIDTSIRAAGMGGADVAVPWGEGSAWGNPATLGCVRGLRWEQSSTRLVPGLADDVRFDVRRLLLGGAGLGISLAGKPAGIGRVRLDYGASPYTDDTGTVIGTFSSAETVESWGYGISMAGLLDAAGAWAGRSPGLARFVDASYGGTFKTTHVALAPARFSQDARAGNRDHGVLARLSPMAILRSGRPGALDIDVAYGRATLNAGNDLFVFGPGPSFESPSTRLEREGWAATAVFHGPPEWIALARRSPWLAAFDPIVRVTWARDSEHNSTGGQAGFFNVERSGTEWVFAGVAEFRRGQVTDRVGQIDGTTWGWGLGLPVGHWGGVRYAHASVPQARDSGLPNVHRNGVSVWADPLAWRTGRPGGVQ